MFGFTWGLTTIYYGALRGKSKFEGWVSINPPAPPDFIDLEVLILRIYLWFTILTLGEFPQEVVSFELFSLFFVFVWI